MGSRSSVNWCSLTIKDKSKLNQYLVAKKIEAGNDLADSISETDKLKKGNNDSDLYVDWEDWKIYGYWLKDFCKFVNELQQLSVRGSVSMFFIDNDVYYEIEFCDDGVYCNSDKDRFLIPEGGLE